MIECVYIVSDHYNPRWELVILENYGPPGQAYIDARGILAHQLRQSKTDAIGKSKLAEISLR